MVQGKRKNINGTPVRVPKSEWVTHENMHEAIITNEIFKQVQKTALK